MEFLDNIALGISVTLKPENMLFCFIGAFLGTAVGVLPGVGPLATIAMLLPITFKLSPEASVIMLAGIYYGAQYGGSTTAILVNLPGEPSSAVTALDGHKMAQQGRAGPALAIAAVGSFFAGTVATFLIAVFAVPLSKFALSFGPVEYFALLTLGLVASIALANGSLLNALTMILFGLLLGTVGTDIYSGTPRFTFGFPGLAEGIPIVALSAGLYGITEILSNSEDTAEREATVADIGSMMPNLDDARASTLPILRGTALGSLLGVLPGGGALLASFGSYAMEKKLSRTPERFGQGAIEGVAGPESANNAAAQTSFVPLLTLGIPSNAIMAMMVGALIIQGVTPGPDLINARPSLFWGVITSMWVGNLMLLALNLPLIGLWLRMLRVPQRRLFPAILVFASVGVYSVNGNVFDIAVLMFFGGLGYLIAKLGFEPAPLLVGFVLGPMTEEYFRRSMQMSKGDPTIFFREPVAAAMLALAAILFALAMTPAIAKKREEIFVEEKQ